MDRTINAPGHEKNVDRLNSTEKRYLNDKMKLIGKLLSNDTTKIGMLPSASTYFSIKFSDQCLHLLSNKEVLNGIKVSTNMQRRESLFKYQPLI